MPAEEKCAATIHMMCHVSPFYCPLVTRLQHLWIYDEYDDEEHDHYNYNNYNYDYDHKYVVYIMKICIIVMMMMMTKM